MQHVIDPHIQKAMELADEYAGSICARDLADGACDFAEIVERWTKQVPIDRAALESSLVALVERVRKETIEEAAMVCETKRRKYDPLLGVHDKVPRTAEQCAAAIRALASPVEK